METNPYEYNRTIPWIPQQNQVYAGRDVSAHTHQQLSRLQKQEPQRGGGDQKPKPPKPMPKARTLALVRTFKKWLVTASLVGFFSFTGLVAYHHVGTTATQTSSGSSQTSSSSTTSSSQKSNSFFNQPGGNNFGSNNSSQGSTSGSSSSSSAPVTGSSVS